MQLLRRVFVLFSLLSLIVESGITQCKTWNDLPDQATALDAHSLYREYIKGKQQADIDQLPAETFKLAFENWKKVYDVAPAANGQNPVHYADGRMLYRSMMSRETDVAKRKEYAEIILQLYDQQMICYKNEGFLLGRKGWDMFYMEQFGQTKPTYEALKGALDKSGKKAEYILFEPMAIVLVALFQKEELLKEEVRKIYLQMEEIADHNIQTNKQYAQYYEAAKARMASEFAEIEDAVFDCTYFKGKLFPKYKENPDDLEVIRFVYSKLKTQGCDPGDPEMQELKVKYEGLATTMNAEMEAEFLAKNPGVHARRLFDDGKFDEAIVKYKEAIEAETDNAKKADYYFGIASIEFRKLNRFSSARDNARKAASLKDGWGQPWMLIGDMYASSSRTCGKDAFERGLAVIAAINMYSKARSVDSEVADEASRRIGRYSGSLPPQEEVHMRGMAGKSVAVPCWIGETVTVRSN